MGLAPTNRAKPLRTGLVPSRGCGGGEGCSATAVAIIVGQTECSVDYHGAANPPPGLTAITWVWTFSDGQVDQGQDVTHLYNTLGPHSAHLVVTFSDFVTTCEADSPITTCNHPDCICMPDFVTLTATAGPGGTDAASYGAHQANVCGGLETLTRSFCGVPRFFDAREHREFGELAGAFELPFFQEVDNAFIYRADFWGQEYIRCQNSRVRWKYRYQVSLSPCAPSFGVGVYKWFALVSLSVCEYSYGVGGFLPNSTCLDYGNDWRGEFDGSVTYTGEVIAQDQTRCLKDDVVLFPVTPDAVNYSWAINNAENFLVNFGDRSCDNFNPVAGTPGTTPVVTLAIGF